MLKKRYPKFIKYFLFLWKSFWLFFKALKYDYIVFVFGITFFMGLDLILLKLLQKKVIMVYCGDDIRLYSIDKNENPFFNLYIVKGSEYDPKKIVKRERRNKIRLKWQSKFVDLCFVKEDLYDFVKIYYPDEKISRYVINHPIYMEDFEPLYPKTGGRLVISHLPSNRVVKGTDYVVKAVERLKREGYDFEFIMPDKFVPHEEALEIIKKSDIVIDQLLTGSFGTLAVEAMAFGKVAIAYISPRVLKTIRRFYSSLPPVINANPDTIYRILKSLFELPRENLRKIGIRSREFVNKEFNVAVVVDRFLSELRRIE